MLVNLRILLVVGLNQRYNCLDQGYETRIRPPNLLYHALGAD